MDPFIHYFPSMYYSLGTERVIFLLNGMSLTSHKNQPQISKTLLHLSLRSTLGQKSLFYPKIHILKIPIYIINPQVCLSVSHTDISETV